MLPARRSPLECRQPGELLRPEGLQRRRQHRGTEDREFRLRAAASRRGRRRAPLDLK
jgi:hypothetical protein